MKKILLVPVMLAALACNFLLGVPATIPAETPETTRPATPSAPTAEISTEETAEPSPVAHAQGFVQVRLHSRNGNLSALLAAESKKAFAMGLMPAVEFDANW